MALQTPNPQLFLNELDDDLVEEFKTAIYDSGTYLDLVNHRHVYAPINLAELATMKSIEPQDGKLYFD